MRMLGRTATVLGLVCLAQAPSLPAQSIIGFDSFKWYIGGQAGVTIVETPTQTRGAVFTAGGHFMVTARRTGLIIAVEEGFKTNQTSSYEDPSAGASGRRQVVFNDIRKYSASLVAFPFKTIAQPYLGIGFGLLQTVKEYPAGPFASAAEQEAANSTANRLGSHTFAAFTGGLQIRVDRFVAFGQYMITTSPGSGRLLIGPSHAFTAGLRVSLGEAREEAGSTSE